MRDDDGWDDDDDADSLESEDELDEEGDELTAPCPYCGRDIYEDAERCPYCERYLSDEDAPPKRKPWWIVAGVVVCLYLVLRWVIG